MSEFQRTLKLTKFDKKSALLLGHGRSSHDVPNMFQVTHCKLEV